MENVICLQRFVSRQIAARDSIGNFSQKSGCQIEDALDRVDAIDSRKILSMRKERRSQSESCVRVARACDRE